jgi:predicted amidophosphoribosyltransferase
MSMRATPNFLGGLTSPIYPPACTICSTSVDGGEYLCPDCELKVSRIVPPFCAKCSKPFNGAITTIYAARTARIVRFCVEAAVSGCRARGIVRHVILNFKYGRQILLPDLVALWLVAALDDDRLRKHHFDAIVPVPSHPARERKRF